MNANRGKLPSGRYQAYSLVESVLGYIQMNEQHDALKFQYNELFQQIEAILFKHDPMKFNSEDLTDEYDLEVGTILPRLKSANSEEDVLNIVHEEFCEWFGGIAGKKSRPVYKKIAAEVWAAWLQHSRPLA